MKFLVKHYFTHFQPHKHFKAISLKLYFRHFFGGIFLLLTTATIIITLPILLIIEVKKAVFSFFNFLFLYDLWLDFNFFTLQV